MVLSLQNSLDCCENLLIEDHVQMSHASELRHVHGLFLFPYPALTETHAAAADGVVAVIVNNIYGVGVWKLFVVHVRDGRREAHPIEAVDLDARCGQTGGEVFGVLPHVPAILKIDVFEELLIVLVGVVEEGGGDEGVVFGPSLFRRDHPRICGGHPLLFADFYIGHKGYAIVFT